MKRPENSPKLMSEDIETHNLYYTPISLALHNWHHVLVIVITEAEEELKFIVSDFNMKLEIYI